MSDDEKPGLVILYRIEGGHPEAMQLALHALEDAVRLLPPALQPEEGNASFHITIRHDRECPCQKSRDMADCTCVDLICEAVLLNEFDIAVLEKTGQYDAEIDEAGLPPAKVRSYDNEANPNLN
jgi:hypothetical protein